ncbi:MAG: tetratricopeptide repeat protein, partial [Thermodesulfobacteriota bacterium]|nr:tetratricopeptide repeat protein [Thermodesulfobacteriota bacterium]
MKEPITAIILLLSILFPLLAVQAGADPQTGREELLTQGASFFRQANESDDPEEARRLYHKSLLRYEKLSREIENGKLYYNIGNVYFRLDDLGRAIVNYRRAEQLITNDPNLRQNLDYALSKRQDKIESKQEEELLRTLFFWHYDLPSSLRMK